MDSPQAHWKRARLLGIALALCLTALVTSGNLHAQKPTTTVTGTVKGAEVYRGKVRSVYIEDSADGDFLVLRGTEKGKELLGHVGDTVTATGYVRKQDRNPKFDQVIDVLSYEIDRSDEGTPEDDTPAPKDD
jgi:hypothetical protein